MLYIVEVKLTNHLYSVKVLLHRALTQFFTALRVCYKCLIYAITFAYPDCFRTSQNCKPCAEPISL